MTNIPVRYLLGPGPSNVHPRVLDVISKPTIGHFDPEFLKLLEKIKLLLRKTFLTENEATILLSGPGSLGMETCFANLIEPGDKVLVCINGFFGARMRDNIRLCGGVPVEISSDWGNPLDLNNLENVLKSDNDIKAVSFVHAETSAGILNDAHQISSIAKKYNCLTIMDAVTSLGCVPVRIDDWKTDAVYSCSQKGLSCPPGLSPVSFSDDAMNTIKKRKTPVRNWFMDMTLLMKYWSGETRTYHHTASSNAYYGFYEGLSLLNESGLEKSWEKNLEISRLFSDEIQKLGMNFLVEEKHRIPHLNAVLIPDGVNDMETRKLLLQKDNIEIGSGLGPLAGKIWRIGLMGYSCSEGNASLLIKALKEILKK